MKKTVFNENDLREAFKAGRLKGMYPSYMQGELDEDEWIREYTNVNDETEDEDEFISITLDLIKKTCGWRNFCNITGYEDSDIPRNDNHIFKVKTKYAKQLNLI